MSVAYMEYIMGIGRRVRLLREAADRLEEMEEIHQSVLGSNRQIWELTVDEQKRRLAAHGAINEALRLDERAQHEIDLRLREMEIDASGAWDRARNQREVTRG